MAFCWGELAGIVELFRFTVAPLETNIHYNNRDERFRLFQLLVERVNEFPFTASPGMKSDYIDL